MSTVLVVLTTKRLMGFVNISQTMVRVGLVLIASTSMKPVQALLKEEGGDLKAKAKVEAQRVKDEVLQLMRLKHRW